MINKYGSIYQNATINAAELKLTSGGNLFIQGKGDGIHNLGPHPDAAFSNYVDPRENAPGPMPASVVKARLAVVEHQTLPTALIRICMIVK